MAGHDTGRSRGSACDLAWAVASYGLPGATPALPDRPLDGDEWVGLLASAVTERALGHLASAIQRDDFPVSTAQRSQIAALHGTAMMHALAVERLAVAATAVLNEAGVGYRLVKGAALAHTVYPDPSVRIFADVDLLVDTAGYAHAVEALVEAGHRRRSPEIRPGYDATFGKGTTLLSPDGIELDLHRTFVFGPLGVLVDVAELFAIPPDTVVLAGRHVTQLDRDLRFVAACYNAAVADVPPRAGAVRDLAQILSVDPPDADTVLAIAQRWGARAVVARAVTLVGALWPSSHPTLTGWATRYRPSYRERRILAGHLRPERSYAATALAALPHVPGVRRKLQLLRALAAPSAGAVNHYESGYAAWLRRGLEGITGRR